MKKYTVRQLKKMSTHRLTKIWSKCVGQENPLYVWKIVKKLKMY
jgi:hypothetical protein